MVSYWAGPVTQWLSSASSASVAQVQFPSVDLHPSLAAMLWWLPTYKIEEDWQWILAQGESFSAKKNGVLLDVVFCDLLYVLPYSNAPPGSFHEHLSVGSVPHTIYFSFACNTSPFLLFLFNCHLIQYSELLTLQLTIQITRFKYWLCHLLGLLH